jgi:hypothetical protein
MKLRLWKGDTFTVKETRALSWSERWSGQATMARVVRMDDVLLFAGKPTAVVEFEEERQSER